MLSKGCVDWPLFAMDPKALEFTFKRLYTKVSYTKCFKIHQIVNILLGVTSATKNCKGNRALTLTRLASYRHQLHESIKFSIMI